MSTYILVAVLGYFIGSIPFSFITAKALGNIDIRNHGSGNSGSTNVLRTLGKKAGLIAFVGDFLKGFLTMILLKHFFGLEAGLLGSAMCVFGHCYPVFLKFKGGKGVATSAGTIFASSPLCGLILLLTFIVSFSISKIVSLCSIIAALSFPIASILFKVDKFSLIYSIALSAFVIYRHRSNISRLLKGEESKITSKTIKK